jgi:uncharacterized phage protein (TIGR01671 family)
MQYTGLKDKNGKEIYEGDIVEWKMGDWRDAIGVTVKDEDLVCRVEWKDDHTGFYPFVEDEGYDGVIMFSVDKCEVIGNIHENPELLK